ncbi:hypothetical protein NHX12_033075 [Muraenolepis orangiensis]|uniref:BRINP C-terminal domain-containing protein n=1 Tax=Muraenolepis orangiensis TaxID=630683 RepID=A0A9Q0IG02_9TELE|nr:hypothetical protein NHX12_033075 [Muraenolepis orangiensis]
MDSSPPCPEPLSWSSEPHGFESSSFESSTVGSYVSMDAESASTTSSVGPGGSGGPLSWLLSDKGPFHHAQEFVDFTERYQQGFTTKYKIYSQEVVSAGLPVHPGTAMLQLLELRDRINRLSPPGQQRLDLFACLLRHRLKLTAGEVVRIHASLQAFSSRLPNSQDYETTKPAS